jgi:hypothetical protein
LFYLSLKEAILETAPPECSVYFFSTEEGAFGLATFTPSTRHKGPEGEQKYNSILSLTSEL